MHKPAPLPALLNEHAASPFAEGAARFAELARSVKAEQIAAQQGALRVTAPAAPPPDEIWSRNFMSRGIGPSGIETVARLAPASHLGHFAPDMALPHPAARPVELVAKPDLGPDLDLPARAGSKSAPIGFGLKPEASARKSWLARLFTRG